MLQRRSTIALALILVFTAMLLYGQSSSTPPTTSYWLWAGITADDAPPNSELYVFQGRIFVQDDETSYERLGLYPHPIKCSKLMLVYRLEGQLPNAKEVVDVFLRSVKKWERHPITVAGIQLDFDSPTLKLVTYSQFLKDVRAQLPGEYQLSVTGLCDWAMSGDKEALKLIATFTDEIVFQLYQGRQPLRDIDEYISGLAKYPLPFRIGLVTGYPMPESVGMLDKNPNYRGVMYFIQKDI